MIGMTNSSDETFGWRFWIPIPEERNSRVHFRWIVGIPDEIDAYRKLVPNARTMPRDPAPQPITIAEAAKLELRHGDVRQETGTAGHL